MPQSHNHSGTSADRRAGWALLALIALALVLRIIAVLLIGPPTEIIGYSESGLVAGNLARGVGYTYDFFGLRPAAPLQAFMPPLYVWLIYACLKLGAMASLLLALAQSALSAATCVAIYLLAEVLSSNRRVAWLSALAAACYPVMILMVTVPASLTLHLAVLAWALAFTARIARRTSTAEAVAAGLCWGLLGLGRPTMLLFVPFVVLWLTWHRNGDRDRRYPWLPAGGLLLLTTFLTVLPWTVRNGVVLGQFVPVSTNGGFVFWNGNNPFTTGSGHEVYTAKADAYLGRSA